MIGELRNPMSKSGNDNNNTILLLVITHVHNPNNPQILNSIKQSMNFLSLSKDIVYIIVCLKYQDCYIAQTQNLQNQVTLHKEQIRTEQYI